MSFDLSYWLLRTRHYHKYIHQQSPSADKKNTFHEHGQLIHRWKPTLQTLNIWQSRNTKTVYEWNWWLQSPRDESIFTDGILSPVSISHLYKWPCPCNICKETCQSTQTHLQMALQHLPSDSLTNRPITGISKPSISSPIKDLWKNKTKQNNK